jgi:hypothetical protein
MAAVLTMSAALVSMTVQWSMVEQQTMSEARLWPVQVRQKSKGSMSGQKKKELMSPWDPEARLSQAPPARP